MTRKSKEKEKTNVPDTRSGFNDPDAPLGVVDTVKADEFANGPLSVLIRAVKEQIQVLINVRNNKKLLGYVKAFDRHCNMVCFLFIFLGKSFTNISQVLQDVHELWSETRKDSDGKKRRVEKSRVISKMFLRGDSVILVLLNPK